MSQQAPWDVSGFGPVNSGQVKMFNPGQPQDQPHQHITNGGQQDTNQQQVDWNQGSNQPWDQNNVQSNHEQHENQAWGQEWNNQWEPWQVQDCSHPDQLEGYQQQQQHPAQPVGLTPEMQSAYQQDDAQYNPNEHQQQHPAQPVGLTPEMQPAYQPNDAQYNPNEHQQYPHQQNWAQQNPPQQHMEQNTLNYPHNSQGYQEPADLHDVPLDSPPSNHIQEVPLDNSQSNSQAFLSPALGEQNSMQNVQPNQGAIPASSSFNKLPHDPSPFDDLVAGGSFDGVPASLQPPQVTAVSQSHSRQSSFGNVQFIVGSANTSASQSPHTFGPGSGRESTGTPDNSLSHESPVKPPHPIANGATPQSMAEKSPHMPAASPLVQRQDSNYSATSSQQSTQSQAVYDRSPSVQSARSVDSISHEVSSTPVAAALPHVPAASPARSPWGDRVPSSGPHATKSPPGSATLPQRGPVSPRHTPKQMGGPQSPPMSIGASDLSGSQQMTTPDEAGPADTGMAHHHMDIYAQPVLSSSPASPFKPPLKHQEVSSPPLGTSPSAASPPTHPYDHHPLSGAGQASRQRTSSTSSQGPQPEDFKNSMSYHVHKQRNNNMSPATTLWQNPEPPQPPVAIQPVPQNEMPHIQPDNNIPLTPQQQPSAGTDLLPLSPSVSSPGHPMRTVDLHNQTNPPAFDNRLYNDQTSSQANPSPHSGAPHDVHMQPSSPAAVAPTTPSSPHHPQHASLFQHPHVIHQGGSSGQVPPQSGPPQTHSPMGPRNPPATSDDRNSHLAPAGPQRHQSEDSLSGEMEPSQGMRPEGNMHGQITKDDGWHGNDRDTGFDNRQNYKDNQTQNARPDKGPKRPQEPPAGRTPQNDRESEITDVQGGFPEDYGRAGISQDPQKMGNPQTDTTGNPRDIHQHVGRDSGGKQGSGVNYGDERDGNRGPNHTRGPPPEGGPPPDGRYDQRQTRQDRDEETRSDNGRGSDNDMRNRNPESNRNPQSMRNDRDPEYKKDQRKTDSRRDDSDSEFKRDQRNRDYKRDERDSEYQRYQRKPEMNRDQRDPEFTRDRREPESKNSFDPRSSDSNRDRRDPPAERDQRDNRYDTRKDKRDSSGDTYKRRDEDKRYIKSEYDRDNRSRDEREDRYRDPRDQRRSGRSDHGRHDSHDNRYRPSSRSGYPSDDPRRYPDERERPRSRQGSHRDEFERPRSRQGGYPDERDRPSSRHGAYPEDPFSDLRSKPGHDGPGSRPSSRQGYPERPRSRIDYDRPRSRSGYDDDDDYRPRSRTGYPDDDKRSRQGYYGDYGRRQHDYYDYYNQHQQYNQYYGQGGYYGNQYYGQQSAYKDQYQKGYQDEMSSYLGSQGQGQQQAPAQQYSASSYGYASSLPRSASYDQLSQHSGYEAASSRGTTPSIDLSSETGADHFARDNGSRPSSRQSGYEVPRGFGPPPPIMQPHAPFYPPHPAAYPPGYYPPPDAYYGHGYGDYSQHYIKPEETQPVEPPRRMTPVMFSRPHVKACFGVGGHLIKILPTRPTDGEPALVEIQDISGMLGRQYEADGHRAFPGPLVRGDTHKMDVVLFCQKMAQRCATDHHIMDRESAELVWRYLELLIKQNGTALGTDVAELLLEGHEPGGSRSRSRQHSGTPASEHSADGGYIDRTVINRAPLSSMQEVTDRFRNLLLHGRKKDALEWAMKQELWGYALFLGSKMDPKTHASVMTRFVSVSLKMSDPLQTLFQLMSHRQPASVTMAGDEKWGDWRPHLAMILSNPTPRHELDKKSVITLGDSLASKRCLYASHFCYLVGDIAFGSYTKKGSKIVLIGSNHSYPLEEFASTTAIQCTEVYEYARSLANPAWCLVPFQIIKFLYIVRLCDCGFMEEALHYCEVLATTILHNPTFFPAALTRGVFTLASHLKSCDPLHLQAGDDAQDPVWLVQLQGVLAGIQDGSIQPVSGTHTPFGLSSVGSSNEVADYMTGSVVQQYPHMMPQTGPLPAENGSLNHSQSAPQQSWPAQDLYPGQASADASQVCHDAWVDQSQQEQPQQEAQVAGAVTTAASYGGQQWDQTAYGGSYLNYMPQEATGTESEQQPQPTQPISIQPEHEQSYNSAPANQELHREEPAPVDPAFSGAGMENVQEEADELDYYRQSTQSVPQTSLPLGATAVQYNPQAPPTFSGSPPTSHDAPPTTGLGSGEQEVKKKQKWPGEDEEDDSHDNKKPKENKKLNRKDQQGSWFGSIFKFGNKSKNEMKLPDDRNPSIVWDDVEKKWKNTDPDAEDTSAPAGPPPKDSELPAGETPATPTRQPSNPGLTSGGPPPPPGSNRFSLQKQRGARGQYVDVFSGSTQKTAAPPNLFNVMPKSASVPAKLFVPSASSEDLVGGGGAAPEQTDSQPPQPSPAQQPTEASQDGPLPHQDIDNMKQQENSSAVNYSNQPPPEHPQQSAPPPAAMPTMFNPTQFNPSGVGFQQAPPPSAGRGPRYGQRRAYPK